MRIPAILAALLALLVPLCGYAQNAPAPESRQFAVITGRVLSVDSQLYVANAEVRLAGTSDFRSDELRVGNG
jgi:hypothetical protein